MNIYRGKILSCHTQALFNAYFQGASYKEYLLFESLTTAAFGVKYIPKDPNRIIDAYIDFDLALNRALDVLGMPYREFIGNKEDADEALSIIIEWLKTDVVVVGPLNMQDIRYLYYPQLYNALDHYLVITKYKSGRFYTLDSEGMVLLSLSEQEFMKAWRGDKVIEGRGYFMMRQVKARKAIQLSDKVIFTTLNNILDNLQQSQNLTNNCANAYDCISKKDISKDTALRVGLPYAIANRLQKNFMQHFFLKEVGAGYEAEKTISEQVSLLNRMHFEILEKSKYDLSLFQKVSDLEKQLTYQVKGMLSLI